ncbi:MAG: transposase [Methylacidiphilales bacterium]|nr:transposase [Candidatus Methylacidiphilales bacterium]
MARQLRIEYGGAFYHVMARGDRREDIVEDKQDRELFLRTLGEACDKTGWRVHAWVLMSNHYHMVLQTPEPNLVAGMKWFQNTYTRRLNCRHHLWGHVFGGRYKAIVVEAGRKRAAGTSAIAYLALLIDYVHLNPLRAGLVNPQTGKGLLGYYWSSLTQGYGCVPGVRPDWLETELGFSLANTKDSASGRHDYVKRLEAIGLSEQGQTLDGQTLNSTLQRGWYWGGQQFREKLLKLLDPKKQRSNRNYRSSPQTREQSSALAEGLIESGLKAFGLKENDLKSTSGSRPEKAVIAAALKEKTTVSQKWIAERLWMKSAGNVCQQVRRLTLGQIPTDKMHQQWQKLVKNS